MPRDEAYRSQGLESRNNSPAPRSWDSMALRAPPRCKVPQVEFKLWNSRVG